MTGDSAGPEETTLGFDTSKPNVARIYDYLLGGKENFAADRHAAKQLLRVMPDAARLARANRTFMTAVVREVAGRGIAQYVDVGAGLPTSPNLHECAQALVPAARVTYVDNDPVVVSHARALLADDDLVTVVSADAREYEALLSAIEQDGKIDLSEPVCVLFVSMLQFIPDSDADALVAAFRDRMAPGSYLVISAGSLEDSDASTIAEVRSTYGSGTTLSGRTLAAIAAYFGDFELLPPGIVPVTEWPVEMPGAPQPQLTRQVPAEPGSRRLLAGVGRKPY